MGRKPGCYWVKDLCEDWRIAEWVVDGGMDEGRWFDVLGWPEHYVEGPMRELMDSVFSFISTDPILPPE
jgi:hypothetical protein